MRLPTGGPLEQIGKNERGYHKTPCIIAINIVGFQWATPEASVCIGPVNSFRIRDYSLERSRAMRFKPSQMGQSLLQMTSIHLCVSLQQEGMSGLPFGLSSFCLSNHLLDLVFLILFRM